MDQKAEKQLAFLKEITRCSGSEDVFEKNIAPVRNVLKKYLPDIYPAHAELCARLESAYERLKDYAAYRQLVKKNIISLAIITYIYLLIYYPPSAPALLQALICTPNGQFSTTMAQPD